VKKKTPNGSFTLRIPDEVRGSIRKRAKANRRTLSGEFLFLVERGLQEVEKPA
jgi:hypothetical protein